MCALSAPAESSWISDIVLNGLVVLSGSVVLSALFQIFNPFSKSLMCNSTKKIQPAHYYLLSWGIAKQNDPVEDEMRREKSSEMSNDCSAVVPWVAFHSPMTREEIVPETGQPLEVEEADMMEMD